MEFPHLGKHCSETSCKQLDFLPVKCDACKKVFCAEHFSYTSHNCTESYKKDNQVPVCPLCNKPIPVPKGQTPDMLVSQHIDTDCQSDPAKEKRGKIFSNKCSKKGCKQKELVPVQCDKCRKNYCLKHRFEMDHDCQGFQGSGRSVSNAGAAAARRVQQPNNAPGAVRTPASRPQNANVLSNIGRDLNRERQERQRAMQGGMSEDEALARAMMLSMNTTTDPPPSSSSITPEEQKRQQEAADAALARALQQSEQEARRSGTGGAGGATASGSGSSRTSRQSSQSDKSSCNVS